MRTCGASYLAKIKACSIPKVPAFSYSRIFSNNEETSSSTFIYAYFITCCRFIEKQVIITTIFISRSVAVFTVQLL